ncbi:hypothetical protein V6N11_050555 [Hibiscus sabdariffa]|uniref:Uncharacterized protein n=1 Tax=Hibiscus sabdariffa TaxID=183260 RepID=A0ABR2TB59_9ROSI
MVRLVRDQWVFEVYVGKINKGLGFSEREDDGGLRFGEGDLDEILRFSVCEDETSEDLRSVVHVVLRIN